MDLAGELARDPGNRLELLAARADQALRRAEVARAGRACAPGRRRAARRAASRSSPCRGAGGGSRARSGAPRRGPAAAAAAPRSPVDRQRLGAAGHEHLLEPLREPDHGRPALDQRARARACPPRAGPCRRRSRSGRAGPRSSRRARRRAASGRTARAVRAARRPSTSSTDEKSSGPGGRDRRGFETAGSRTSCGAPPSNTTIEATVCSPPMFEMSKPSIRTGSDSSSSASWRAESASTRCGAAAPARSLSWASASTALRSASSRRRRLSPALGDPHLDRPAAAGRQRLGEQAGAVAHRRADDDQPRHRGRGGVVLGEELLGDLGLVALGLVGEVEAVALGEHARRGPGTPARWPPAPSTATATRSASSSASPATLRRSISERTASRRSR